jgi:hypothetical protein
MTMDVWKRRHHDVVVYGSLSRLLLTNYLLLCTRTYLLYGWYLLERIYLRVRTGISSILCSCTSKNTYRYGILRVV